MTSSTTQPADTVNDKIKLDFTFDVEKMKAEVETMKLGDFLYYDSMPLRAPAHEVDPSIPFPPPAFDYADGTWCDWLDTPQLKGSPYLNEVINTFKDNTRITLVRILRLQAGSVVKEHTDPTLGLQIHKSVIRLTIPIVSEPEVEFYLNNEIVPMKPGECWYMRLTDPHKIFHKGSTTRTNMTIDMEPNEWIRSIIEAKDGQ